MEETVPLRTSRPASRGVALFAKGFRPFFLLAAIHAVLVLPTWLLVHTGHLGVGDYLLPTAWHAHEMVFGFAVAVIAGFLLTAAANWTKRETASGGWLAALALAWLAGRVAPWLGGALPDVAIAALSLAFLPLLAFAVGRPIVAARSRRNYGLLALLLALWLAQVATHRAALEGAALGQVVGPRVAVDLVVVVILVIGGRVIPLFTRNATGAAGIRSIPWADALAIGAAVAVAAADALLLDPAWLGAFAALAAAASAIRMIGWGARHTRREPLLWVLHVGYAFVPIGFALRAAAAFAPAVGGAAALHALTVGAIGVLTLGMMTRVSLGHTGRILAAPVALGVAFALLALGAIVRVVGPLLGGAVTTPSVHAAGGAWALAFAIYLARIGPLLWKPRPDGRPG